MLETLPRTEGAQVATTHQPRLLDVLRDRARRLGHSERTVAAYVQWVMNLIRFHSPRHPRVLLAPDLGRFLSMSAGVPAIPCWRLKQREQPRSFSIRESLGWMLVTFPGRVPRVYWIKCARFCACAITR